MAGALEGIRIVDATEGVAGGYCTRLLAGLGADVLKLERPGAGDPVRRAGPFPNDRPHIETSGLHLHLSAGKRSATLELASATGASIARRLIERADVFVQGDGAVYRSLQPDVLRERFPDKVIATLTPFGTTGPRATWRATEIVAGAIGGYVTITGDRDRPPVKPYGHAVSYQAGVHAALGIAASLRRDGEHVDVAIAEASTFLLGTAVARAAVMGRPAARNGARVVGFGPNFLYPSTVRPCNEGYVHAHGHNRFRDLLSVLTGEPRLNDDDVRARPIGHADEVDALLDRWLASRDKWTAVREAQELRIPFAEVLDPREVVEDRLGQLTARGFLERVEHPVAGVVTQPAAPVRMPASPWRALRAPLLGEHNSEVYRGELGMSGLDLARLAAAGAL